MCQVAAPICIGRQKQLASLSVRSLARGEREMQGSTVGCWALLLNLTSPRLASELTPQSTPAVVRSCQEVVTFSFSRRSLLSLCKVPLSAWEEM
ncbi:unnamed protein product [Lampetra planeri]